jgi:CRP/FNR family transcriptional regulator, dissimilatory nitrate respiration regulator
MKKHSQLLSQSFLFGELPEEHMDAILAIAIEKKMDAGEQIFLEGDPANGFYMVAEGMVKIYKLSPGGKEQILHMFGPGEPFGEVPVFSGGVFPANAEAVKTSTMIFFPRKDFVGLIMENPLMALNMLAVLSKRLRHFTIQVENLSLKEVPARLAGYLLLLAQEQNNTKNVTLKITKGQLAGFLGTIPETLSRMLKKMSDQNLIAVEGRKIRLVDYDGLIDLAETGKIDSES